jgi:hypothetical protein
MKTIEIIKRFLNVCTLLILVGTAVGTFGAITSSNVAYELYKSIGIGGCLLIFMVALNYILFNKLTIFHKKVE